MNRKLTTFGFAASRAAVVLFLLAVLPVLTAARAEAQLNPLWDHYKVYLQNPPSPPLGIAVVLKDQFGEAPATVTTLDRFMNPVLKIHLGNTFIINDPTTHYSWWKITTPATQPVLVNATNQFGTQQLTVGNAQYLLNPALKSPAGNPPPSGDPPTKNHYKCYDVTGNTLNVPITMTDQFDTWNATTLIPRYLLNPVDKLVVQTGREYPILDPDQHYVVYEFLPPDPQAFTASMLDQFTFPGAFPLNLHPGLYICVPSIKVVVPVELSKFSVE